MKINNSLFILAVICFYSNTNYSQFEIIETSTNSQLDYLHKLENSVLVLGWNDYYMRYFENNLTSINDPGPIENVIHNYNHVGFNKGFITSSLPALSGDHNYIFKTSDDCNTWDEVFDTADVLIQNLTFFDSLEAIFTSSPGRQFRTIDGGYSWDIENCINIVNAIQSFDDSIVCIGGLEKFSISYNRGKTWLAKGYIMNTSANSIDFISKDTILITGGGYFSKTYNAGLNRIDQSTNGFYATKVTHKDDVIYMIGAKSVIDEFGNFIGHGTILRSYDLGNTWSTIITDYITTFNDIEFLNDSIALICGTNGVLLKYFYRDHNLGIEDEASASKQSVQILPNPSSNVQNIKLKSSNNEKVEISLYDITGTKVKDVFNGFIHEGETELKVDLSNLSSGLYVYKINKGKEVFYLKSQKL